MKRKDPQFVSPGLIRGLWLWSATAVVAGLMIGQSIVLPASDAARDRAFFQFAKPIQAIFRTPSWALIFEACAASLRVFAGTYQEIYSFAIFAYWMFYALTAAALIGLRRREPVLPRPYRVWGYPWTAWIFGIVALAISANLLWAQPARRSVGLAIILPGFPFIHYRCRRPSDANVSGGNRSFPRATAITNLRSSPWRAGG